MKTRAAVDVSELPTYAYGHRSILWWGTLGFVAIEGAGFFLAIGAYIYIRGNYEVWPPNPAPNLLWGTVNLALLLLSIIPNFVIKKVAEQERLRAVQIALVVMSLVGLATVAVRGMEFTTLNVWWDDNAYGSATWVLLGLHAGHLLTDWVDTLVLTVLFLLKPVGGKRFVDVSENAFYWYFIVLSWVPVYLVIYFGPRWL